MFFSCTESLVPNAENVKKYSINYINWLPSAKNVSFSEKTILYHVKNVLANTGSLLSSDKNVLFSAENVILVSTMYYF